jgi:hypothetical protein
MGSPNTSVSPERSPEPEAGAPEPSVAHSPTATWAGQALLLTAVCGAAAKSLGVLVEPGMRGVASQNAMELTELAAATMSYAFAALLVLLIGGGSLELARIPKLGAATRLGVVASGGLVVALTSPALVQRLHSAAALALALLASAIGLAASMSALRVAHTRAVGTVLGLMALSGVLRPVAWELTVLAGERASLGLYQGARGLATFAVGVQGFATLLAAAWLGTRSRTRGRLLANAAIVLACGLTFLAAHDGGDAPSSLEAVLHGSLAQAAGSPSPYGLASISAFLVPATILLALVSVVQRTQAPAVRAALALTLLSQGSFDVPLQALAFTAAAQWALLAMADDRAMWTSLTATRAAQS